MPATGNSGLIAAANDTVSISCIDTPAVGIEVYSGSAWTATLVVEATIDGTTWFTPSVQSPTGASASASITANGRVIAMAPGCAAVRVRCSAYTSGTPLTTLRATRAV